MNDARWKERIQDYLDDRMDAEQRAAFESDLSRHPERAAEVERDRELGALLREDAIELPPGLARRARTRFEASRQPRQASILRWAWPAAAVAGAAMLLVTFGLFAPSPSEGNLEPPDPPLVARTQLPKQEAADELPAEVQAKVKESLADAPQRDKKRSGKMDKPADPSRFAPAPQAPTASGRISSDADLRANAGAGADEVDDLASAASEPRIEAETNAEEEAKAEPRAKSALEIDLVEDAERRVRASSRERGYATGQAASAAAVEGLTMAGFSLAGRIDPGRRLEEDPQALARWVAAEPVLRQIGFDPVRQRLVLVGGLTDSFPCGALQIEHGADGYRLVEPTSDGRRQDSDGESSCAIALPRDGRPVRLEPDDRQ